MFELKQQSRNYRHVGNFPTCRQMSCRLDTLADTTFSCVCDVTSDVSRHVARHDTECRHLGTKTTRRHPTCRAKVLPLLSLPLSPLLPSKLVSLHILSLICLSPLLAGTYSLLVHLLVEVPLPAKSSAVLFWRYPFDLSWSEIFL